MHPNINPTHLHYKFFVKLTYLHCQMKNKYIDLIEQSFEFPQDEFRVEDGEMMFHNIPVMDLIEQYGTPLKITYLPKISSQIQSK